MEAASYGACPSLASLSIMSSRSTLWLQIALFHSFSWLDNIPIYTCGVTTLEDSLLFSYKTKHTLNHMMKQLRSLVFTQRS